MHGHHDGGFYTGEMRVTRHRLCVVAGGHGDHPRRTLRRRHQGNAICRPALLKSAGRLQMVVFQMDFRAGRLAQPVGIKERRAQHRTLDPPGRGFDVREGEGKRGGSRCVIPPHNVIHR